MVHSVLTLIHHSGKFLFSHGNSALVESRVRGVAMDSLWRSVVSLHSSFALGQTIRHKESGVFQFGPFQEQSTFSIRVISLVVHSHNGLNNAKVRRWIDNTKPDHCGASRWKSLLHVRTEKLAKQGVRS
jgi:hypothetical protein